MSAGGGKAREKIDPPGRKFPAMSQAIRCGDTVFVSGQVAFDATGEVVGEGDAAIQTDQALANLEGTLRAAGARNADVVKLTSYLVDPVDYPAYAASKASSFGEIEPASTCVIVSALADPRLLVEVEAIAVIDSESDPAAAGDR